MNDEKNEVRTIKFIIRVKGHLDSRWEHWFDGISIRHVEDGMTILSGEVADQCAFHGLLEKIYGLNLSVISFEIVDCE